MGECADERCAGLAEVKTRFEYIEKQLERVGTDVAGLPALKASFEYITRQIEKIGTDVEVLTASRHRTLGGYAVAVALASAVAAVVTRVLPLLVK